MFTVEMDFDEIAITILDETGQYEDVQFFIYDDIVYIRQYFEKVDAFGVVAMTPEMFEEFRKSLDKPEGAYIVRDGKNDD